MEKVEVVDQIKNNQNLEQQQKILNRLNTIRFGKSKILKTLSIIKKNENSDKEIDKELVEKLISSYDLLKQQEESFILAIKNLLDLPNDLLLNNKDLIIPENSCEKLEIDGKNETNLTQVEAEQLVENAITASDINDNLKDNIRNAQQKIASLKKVYEENLKNRTKIANQALQDVEFAKLQIGQQQNSINCKQKLLERLRKKVAAKVNLNAQKVESNNNTNSLRIPPIDSFSINLVNHPQSNETETKNNDNYDKFVDKKSDIYTTISHRFASFEARKQRMRDLRIRLNYCERKKMDKTYSDALSRLENLSKMRKKLESISSKNSNFSNDISENELNNDSNQKYFETNFDNNNMTDFNITKNELNDNELNQNLTNLNLNNNTNDENSKILLCSASDNNKEDDNKSISTDEKSLPVTTKEENFKQSNIDLKKCDIVRNHLNSNEAKLEKERVLESICNFTIGQSFDDETTENKETTTEKENLDDKFFLTDSTYKIDLIDQDNNTNLELSKELKKEIYQIIKKLITWINVNIENKSSKIFDHDVAAILSDLVLNEAVNILNFNFDKTKNDVTNTSFVNQLKTTIDDIFAVQINNEKNILEATINNQKFINDLSENLYNELAFWKLLHRADSLMNI